MANTEYTARIVHQGNGSWLVYGINAYGNRSTVTTTEQAAIEWARNSLFTSVIYDGQGIVEIL